MTQNAIKIEGIDVILDYLISQSELVFWISKNNFTEQVFLSKTFNTLWGRSRETQLENPTQWSASIHHDDRERAMKTCALRLDAQTFKEGQCILYRIVKPNNETLCIKDVCFQMSNEEQKITCLAGISKVVTSREYDALLSLPSDQRYDMDDESRLDLSRGLTDTLRLSVPSLFIRTPSKIKYNVITADQDIQLSPRLAQCLYLLYKGLHTKHIADLMGLTVSSVKIYIERLRQKIGARNRVEMFNKIINLYHIETWNFPLQQRVS